MVNFKYSNFPILIRTAVIMWYQWKKCISLFHKIHLTYCWTSNIKVQAVLMTVCFSVFLTMLSHLHKLYTNNHENDSKLRNGKHVERRDSGLPFWVLSQKLQGGGVRETTKTSDNVSSLQGQAQDMQASLGIITEVCAHRCIVICVCSMSVKLWCSFPVLLLCNDWC